MPDRLISVFAIVIASALLMTSITSAQETPMFPGSPEIETEQPSRILDATRKSGSSDDPFPSSAGKAATHSDQPFSITETRHRLDSLEQSVLQLAERVRAMEANQGKDHAESVKLRAELRTLVQKTFAARQQIQRAELAEFTRRLQLMQQTIDAREQSVDRIVERRVEELLDPNLNWTQSGDEKNPSTAAFRSDTREGEAPAEPSAQNGSGITAAQQALQSRGTPPDENSTTAGSPPKPVVVKQIDQDAQKVTLTMYEVTDADFMKDREINAEPSVVPTDLDLDDQLKKMRDSKTVTLLGSHTIETTLNRTATFHSGGTFEVPSSLPGESKRDVEFGTKIMILPRMQGDEKVFKCRWDERTLIRNSTVDGIPGLHDKRCDFLIKSPRPGGTEYLCGPFAGSDDGHRRFILFYLHDETEATQVSTEQPKRSQDLLTSLQGEWEIEQLSEGDMEKLSPGAHPRATVAGDLLKFHAATGEVNAVFQLEALPDKKVIAVLDPNGQRLKLSGLIEFTAERFQLCLGSEGTPPAVIAPGEDVIYLSAKRPSGSTADSTTSGSPAASAEFLKRLQGNWKCKVFNVEGETLSDPDAAIPIVRIEGAVVSVELKIRGVDEDYPSSKEPEEREVRTVWLLELVGSGTPQQVNLLVDPNGEKRQQYGIVECTEDRLRICVGAEDAPSELNRPAIFAPGSKVIYLEAQRQTPDADPIPQPKVPDPVSSNRT